MLVRQKVLSEAEGQPNRYRLCSKRSPRKQHDGVREGRHKTEEILSEKMGLAGLLLGVTPKRKATQRSQAPSKGHS